MLASFGLGVVVANIWHEVSVMQENTK